MVDIRLILGSALKVLLLVVPLVFSCHARANQVSEELLDVLAGGGEPGPAVISRADIVPGASHEPMDIEAYEEALKLTHETLITHGFQVVTLSADLQGEQLSVDLYHPRISGLNRVIGRAARILNLYAPRALHMLQICYMDQAVVEAVCYQIDRVGLNLYFERLISRWQLRHYVRRSEYRGVRAGSLPTDADSTHSPLVVESSASSADFSQVDQGLLSGYSIHQSNRFSLVAQPVDIGRYLNDQDGGMFLDMRSGFSVDAYLGKGWSISSSVFYRWFSPDGAEGSDSELPRVRSNIDLYRDSKEVKIDSLYVSYSTKISENSYFNANLGYQEEMFGGLSTQLYFPSVQEFLDVEFRGDWVSQRDIEDPQSFDDYDVVSALLGLRLRWHGLPNDMRIYAGRFLAEDNGVRFDIGHRFSNGARLAFWYSYTDEKDEMGPGSPGDAYRSRGISLTLPLNAVNKRRDTQKVYNLEYLPHVRDTGQMLHWPVDLSANYNRRPGSSNKLEQFGQ